jgi:polysaccharide chain length determinant protein (PEP-CTERM system associated)
MPSVASAKTWKGGRTVVEHAQILLRRPWHIAVPFTAVLVLAVAASFIVPKKYRSSTLILVESERVPEAVVPKMAAEAAGKRLQTIRQEILSRTRLETVIKELDPYGSTEREPMTVTVERMRKAIAITVKGDDAFSIDYLHREPRMAMLVANRLATLFIEEVSRGREAQVAGAYSFIEGQLEEARQQLQVREGTLRAYKERHMGSLPEQLTANLSTLQRLQLEQQAVTESLRAASERLRQVESDPTSIAGRDPASQELAQARAQLSQLRLRYTEEHPEVRALAGRIARLEAAVVKTADAGAQVGASAVSEARRDVEDLRARQNELEGRIALFSARVEQTPRVEQEISTLTRDFQKLNEYYLGLLDKKLDAQTAAEMEKRWKGDRFRVLDPANLPERPVSPNRLLFLAFGIAFGLLAGVGASLAAEHLSQAVNKVEEIEGIVPAPILATIPYVRGARARRRA